MFTALIIVEVLISILLIIAVLMQASKGGGLAGTFGGGQVGSMFGVRRTADFLSNFTWILAASFVLIALAVNIFFLPRTSSGDAESVLQRSSQGAAPNQVPSQLPPTTPVTPAPQPQQSPAQGR
jgi:preprotein translocase subunit SecG